MNKALKLIGALAAVGIVAVVSFAGGVVFERQNLDWHPPLKDRASLAGAVAEVAGIIDREALEPASETSLTAGAITGMMMALDDPYANYFDPKHFEYFNEQTSGTFYGIGVTIQNKEDLLVIASVIADTPAERAGLKADDVIVEIDGETRMKWDVDEAVLRIRGAEGTNVTLGIARADEEDLLHFTITRAKIDLPNIESELLDGGVGYMRLYSFSEPAVGDVREAIEDLDSQGARGYVLDLRDNPGGLLSSSVDVSSLFIADGVIVRVEDRNGMIEEHRAKGRTATDKPVVVLVNGNSASASEIVAGALQDHDRATLVGEQSFGKGSVQQIENLTFGGGIKLTIAHYLTPKGNQINKKGLTPDVVVTMDAELQRDKATDTQLKKAIEVLRAEF